MLMPKTDAPDVGFATATLNKVKFCIFDRMLILSLYERKKSSIISKNVIF